MLELIASAAAEGGEETSHTLFYVVGGVLAVFAVVISVIGIRKRETFPASAGAARGVMALAALLVVATMAAAVVSG